MAQEEGKVMTADGPMDPSLLGSVPMHEHVHCDVYDWIEGEAIKEEKPITAGRRGYLMEEAVPFLQQCTQHGCYALVDATPPPMRAWPTFYREVTEASGMSIVLSTGFYCELTVGQYWAKTLEDRIWPFVLASDVERLADFCIQELTVGINGTDVMAGAIKLGTWTDELTDIERKCFAAGARAQKATGVHITTHCWRKGAETDQLRTLDKHGVDLSRVVVGHTAHHLMDPDCRKLCIDWMRHGANFLPTNLGIGEEGGREWQPLINAIHEVFDLGLGDHIAGFGLDYAFVSENGPFGPCGYIPPPPYLHMFTHTLPAFRAMGLTPEEEEAILVKNPANILPVQ